MSSLRDVLSHVFLHSQAAAAATVLSGTLVPASEIASRHAEDDAERAGFLKLTLEPRHHPERHIRIAGDRDGEVGRRRSQAG